MAVKKQKPIPKHSFNPDPNELLVSEYNFVSGLVYKSDIEEIPKEVFNFDIATFAGIAIGIFGGQYIFSPANLPLINFGLAVYFFWLSIRGLITVYILIRKRSEWHNNSSILIRIKDFYIRSNPNVADAISISHGMLQSKFSLYSISFILAVQVSIFSGGALALTTYLVLAGFSYFNGYIISIIVGFSYLIFLIWLYRYLLTKEF